MKPEGSFKFEPALDVIECPCGGSVNVGRCIDPDGTETDAVLHSMPMCADFERLDEPADFLHWLRVTKYGRDDDEPQA